MGREVAWGKGAVRIEHNAGCTDSRDRNIVSPEAEDEVDGGDFEGDEQGFVDEEVPADHEAKSIINPMASKTDKATRDRHISVHLSDRVVGETEDHGV